MPANAPEGPDPRRTAASSRPIRTTCSPGGLVQSFIDNVNGVHGGSLSPTVKINFRDGSPRLTAPLGQNGLGPFGYLPTNLNVGGAGHYK